MSDPSGFDILTRMLPSLALIVGGLLLVRRWAQRGRPGGGDNASVRVVTRTGLTRGAMLAVVEVGGRRYLLGAGEQGVSLLTELDPSDPFSPAGVTADTDVIDLNNAVMDPALSLRPASSPDRPWMGLINRLQAMTVRSHPQRPVDALRTPRG